MYPNSQFCVRIGHVLTESFNVGIVVRQGDPLRPNLFKIFINDLPSYLESTADPVHVNNTCVLGPNREAKRFGQFRTNVYRLSFASPLSHSPGAELVGKSGKRLFFQCSINSRPC